MGWATIPRTTPWETMGLREASLGHKVRPQGGGVRGVFVLFFTSLL